MTTQPAPLIDDLVEAYESACWQAREAPHYLARVRRAWDWLAEVDELHYSQYGALLVPSANTRDRARRIYDLAKELQDDLSK